MTKSPEFEHRLTEVRRSMAGTMTALFDLVDDAEGSQAHLPEYPDVANWLSWHLGVSVRTARRWVRTARALRDLPILRAAFRSGHISDDQLQLLLRVTTADNQQDLVDLARATGNPAVLRAEIRNLQPEEDSAGQPEPDREPPAWLDTWWDDDRLHLRGWVAGSDGATIDHALRRLAAHAPVDEATGLFRHPGVTGAEALVQMASESLAGDGDHDRATLVVHIPADALTAERGRGWGTATPIFPTAELQRLACDARLQPALEDHGGTTVGVGRTTRTIPAWLRRMVEGRDNGCRFPGCGRTRWLHCHHLVPWAQGGPTNLDNLVVLCGYHHRLIHRNGWTIDGDPNRRLTFLNEWGRPHTPAHDRYPPNWIDTLLHRTGSRRPQPVAGPP